MEVSEFINLKERFNREDIEGKIDIYVNTAGLSFEQYTALLHDFPREALGELDKRLG